MEPSPDLRPVVGRITQLTIEPRPASPIVITAEGIHAVCVHCAGKGFRVSAHPMPWLSSDDQGTALYRTKLCCLYCGGTGLHRSSTDATPAQPTTPLVTEPVIDADFTREEDT